MRGVVLAVSAIWGLTVMVALYAIVRVLQYVIFPEANPATVIWSPHSGYFWRVWIVLFGGGFAAIIGYVLASRALARTARGLPVAVGVASLLLAAQSIFVP